jgi:hypothetical protein
MATERVVAIGLSPSPPGSAAPLFADTRCIGRTTPSFSTTTRCAAKGSSASMNAITMTLLPAIRSGAAAGMTVRMGTLAAR